MASRHQERLIMVTVSVWGKRLLPGSDRYRLRALLDRMDKHGLEYDETLRAVDCLIINAAR